MKKPKFIVTAVLFIFISTAAVYAEDTEAVQMIASLREDVLSQILNDDEILIKYELYTAKLDKMENRLSEKDSLYYRSLLEYWMARTFQSIDDVETSVMHTKDFRDRRFFRLKRHYPKLEQAVEHYELSLQAINDYLKIEKDSAGLRQLSEIQGQMIFLKNPGYTFRTGMSIKRNLKKSLKLEPDNIKSIIMDGTSDIYMPSGYGGDIEEGIEKLESLIHLPGCDKEDYFNIYTGIAYGLILSERTAQADPWLEKANLVFPNNVFLRALIQIVEEDN